MGKDGSSLMTAAASDQITGSGLFVGSGITFAVLCFCCSASIMTLELLLSTCVVGCVQIMLGIIGPLVDIIYLSVLFALIPSYCWRSCKIQTNQTWCGHEK